jgi:hypothetical protein
VSQFIVTCNYVKGLKNIIFQDVKTKANVIVKKSTLRRITAETLATFTCSPFFIFFKKHFFFAIRKKTFFYLFNAKVAARIKKNVQIRNILDQNSLKQSLSNFSTILHKFIPLFFSSKKTAKTETRIV